ALAVEARGPRIDERRRLRIGTIHRDAFLPVAGDEMHCARFEIDGANAAIVEIGDQQSAPLGIEGDAVDAAELSHGGGTVVAGIWFLAAHAGEGVDDAGLRIELADPVVPSV